jgi:CheY-like chemotaxis protein
MEVLSILLDAAYYNSVEDFKVQNAEAAAIAIGNNTIRSNREFQLILESNINEALERVGINKSKIEAVKTGLKAAGFVSGVFNEGKALADKYGLAWERAAPAGGVSIEKTSEKEALSSLKKALDALAEAVNADVYYSSHGEPVNIPKQIRLRQLNELRSDILSHKELWGDFIHESIEKIKDLIFKLSPELRVMELFLNKPKPSMKERLYKYMDDIVEKAYIKNLGIMSSNYLARAEYFQEKIREKIFIIINDNPEEGGSFLKKLQNNGGGGYYFESASEALEFIARQENKKKIIVLADLFMQFMDGWTLRDKIKKIDNDILVLAASAPISNVIWGILLAFDGMLNNQLEPSWNRRPWDMLQFVVLIGSLQEHIDAIEIETEGLKSE